jgi:hypothetical protein
MSRKAFDKISAGLRDAAAGRITRVTIDGVTWVRQDEDSPEAALAAARDKIADLTQQLDIARAEVDHLRLNIPEWAKQQLERD